MLPEYINGLAACARTLKVLEVEVTGHLQSLSFAIGKSRSQLEELSILGLCIDEGGKTNESLIEILQQAGSRTLSSLKLSWIQERGQPQGNASLLPVCKAIVQFLPHVSFLSLTIETGLCDECLQILAEGCHCLTECSFQLPDTEKSDYSGIQALVIKHPALAHCIANTVLTNEHVIQLCRHVATSSAPLLSLENILQKRREIFVPLASGFTSQDLTRVLHYCLGLTDLDCHSNPLASAVAALWLSPSTLHTLSHLTVVSLSFCRQEHSAGLSELFKTWKSKNTFLYMQWRAHEAPSLSLWQKLTEHKELYHTKWNFLFENASGNADVYISSEKDEGTTVEIEFSRIQTQTSLWDEISFCLSNFIAAHNTCARSTTTTMVPLHVTLSLSNCRHVKDDALWALCLQLPSLDMLKLRRCNLLTSTSVTNIINHFPAFACYRHAPPLPLPVGTPQPSNVQQGIFLKECPNVHFEYPNHKIIV